jgi:hypothetical protein
MAVRWTGDSLRTGEVSYMEWGCRHLPYIAFSSPGMQSLRISVSQFSDSRDCGTCSVIHFTSIPAVNAIAISEVFKIAKTSHRER